MWISAARQDQYCLPTIQTALVPDARVDATARCFALIEEASSSSTTCGLDVAAKNLHEVEGIVTDNVAERLSTLRTEQSRLRNMQMLFAHHVQGELCCPDLS